MESLEYLFGGYDLYNEDELSNEIPMGWSSVCLDQTINYYIECNSLNSQPYHRQEENESVER